MTINIHSLHTYKKWLQSPYSAIFESVFGDISEPGNEPLFQSADDFHIWMSCLRARSVDPRIAPLKPIFKLGNMTIKECLRTPNTDTILFLQHLRKQLITSANCEVARKASKIVHMRCLQDDFYLNLLDWSTSNIVAVALGQKIYYLNGNDLTTISTQTSIEDVTHGREEMSILESRMNHISDPGLTVDSYSRDLEESRHPNTPVTTCLSSGAGCTGSNPVGGDISAVSWKPFHNLLAAGRKTGYVQIWDVDKKSILRSIPSNHTQRIGALDWNNTPNAQHGGSFDLLAAGSRDKSVTVHDLRIQKTVVNRWDVHKQEVCGLKWRGFPSSLQDGFCGPVSGDSLLASGGNDNRVLIWKLSYQDPIVCLDGHTAAVKALAWNPSSQTCLATGGGTNDRHIRIWDVMKGTSIFEIDSESQVCNAHWDKYGKRLVTTHGYTHNNICIWNYDCEVGLDKMCTLRGHTSRVLYTAMSPNQETLVSGAGDESIRLWHVFSTNEF